MGGEEEEENLKKRGTEFGPAVISGLLSIAFRAVYRMRLDWLK